MAWTEQSIFDISEPQDTDEDAKAREEDRIRSMFQGMPPFIKVSSRRAREALVKYEAFKQRYIENLRNNPVYKFVMNVAAYTNEDMEKYWRGKPLSPFMEDYVPQNIKIDKEDVELLVARILELWNRAHNAEAISSHRRRGRRRGVAPRRAAGVRWCRGE